MNAARITVPANIQHLLTLARAPGPVRDAIAPLLNWLFAHDDSTGRRVTG